MTTVRQVYEAMQAIAPLELAEHWDNPGLLVDCGGRCTGCWQHWTSPPKWWPKPLQSSVR